MPQALINEQGNKYGSLTVLELTKDKNGRTAWLCKCDCGNTKIVRGSDLRTNKITHCSKSCPCKVNGNFIDETNNQYGYLTVLYKSSLKSPSQKTLWHCKCECGNEIDVLGESLRDGRTKSCGCKTNEFIAAVKSKDIKNQKFGYLIPLEKTEFTSEEGNIWRCKCLCGCNREDIYLSTHRLLSKNTQSCGRLRQSHGEIAIENFLQENKIQYQKEYTFNNLYSNKANTKFRFDFAIFNENNLYCLIEFDGEQHFKPVEYFGGKEALQKRIEYDKIKTSYCEENSISLFRIKYNDNIEEKLKDYLKEII